MLVGRGCTVERSQGQDPDLVLQIWGISEIGDPNTVP